MDKLNKVLYTLAVGLGIGITALISAVVIMWGFIQLAKLI
jgi:ABC-type lipoprotein release transport system permease subunit